MRNLLLSIDVGTTAIKAGVFTLDGKMLANSYMEYPLLSPQTMCVEQDANLWWDLSVQSVRGLLERNSGYKHDISAMSVSAQGISYVPVNKDGIPLHNAFSWLDTRAVEQTNRLKNLFDNQSEAFMKLGLHIVPTYTLPKIMWLKDNKRDIFEKTYKFSTCLDFMNKRLVGKFITDYSIAGGTLAHNIKKLRWASDLLNCMNIPEEKFPAIDWAGSLLGELSSNTAKELGLDKNVKIILGGHDQECASLGAGLSEGEVSISMGSASILIAPIPEPVFDSKLRIPCYPHIEKSKFVLEAVISAAGISFRWLRDLFNSIVSHRGNGGFDYEDIVELAKKSPPGSNGVKLFPHLSGATSPFWKPDTSGMFYGLSLATNEADLARALLEGWCYQLKTNLLVLDELTDRHNNVVIFGGGVRSCFIQKLLANVLGRPTFATSNSETALLGAAILAGLGLGLYNNLSEIKHQIRKDVFEIHSDRNSVKAYKDFYNEYVEIEQSLI